jgi:hypothetical protein
MIKKLAPLTGVAFFVLLLVSALISNNSLKGSSSGVKVLDYYEAHRNSTRISGLLTVIAVFVGVIFYGLLRDHLRRHEESRGLTATAFGGVVLFAASGGLSAGIDWALTESPSHTSPAAAQALNLVSMDMTYGLMLAGLAILFFAFGLAIVRGKLLPAWLGWVAFPLALVALIPPIGFIAFIGAGVWTLFVSIVMWLRLANADAPTTAAPAGGAAN